MTRRQGTHFAQRVAVMAVAALTCLLARPGRAQEDEPVPAPPPAADAAAEEDRQQPRQPQPPAKEHREHSLEHFDQAGKTPADVTMTHSGEFVGAQGNEFVMRSQGRQHSHTLGEDAQITLNGRRATLRDLRPGDQITVIAPKTELGTALQVRATRGDARQGNANAGAQEEDFPPAPDDPERQPRQAGRQPQDQREQSGGAQQPDQTNRGALGVFLGESQEGQGVVIQDVAPNSSAAQAGIRPGDRILSIEEQEVASADDVLQAMAEKNAGERVNLQIARNGRTMNVAVTLGTQRNLAFRQQQEGQPGFQEGPPAGSQQHRGQPFGQQGEGSKAWLGIMLRDDRDPRQPGREGAEDQPPQEGAVIAQVYPSGPAARAGIMAGDVIIRLGEHDVESLDALYQAMDELEPNQEIEITVNRNGEEQTLKARLASRQDFFGEQFRGFREEFGGEFPGQRDPFGGAPEHSMMLEQQRHLATQHQRLEDLLNDVLEEVKELRREVQQLKGGETRNDDNQ